MLYLTQHTAVFRVIQLPTAYNFTKHSGYYRLKDEFYEMFVISLEQVLFSDVLRAHVFFNAFVSRMPNPKSAEF